MTGFTLPTSRPITQQWAAEFDDWDGDGIVDIPGGFYHSIGWFGHNGIDYGCQIGDPVYAIADGIVEFCGNGDYHPLLSGGGNVVFLRHPAYGVWSESLHLSEILVEAGQSVKKDQLVARSGASGASTAPHLHLGMFRSNVPNQNDGWRGRINPTPFLYGNLNSDYAVKAQLAKEITAMPIPVLHRVASPKMNRRLAKGNTATITTDATNKTHMNFAIAGYGLYQGHVFIEGTGLADGEKITGRFVIVKAGKRSGYFPFQIDGSADGTFSGGGPLLWSVATPTSIEIELTSTSDTAYVRSVAADLVVTSYK